MGDLIFINVCRSCGHMPLVPILSFGTTPLANALWSVGQQDEERYPLDLLLCENCSLVQLSITVTPSQMFEKYPYFSSVSDEMQKHAQDLAYYIIASRRLDRRHLVVEIGSNDGYLLRHFVAAGISAVGVEPARNVATVAESRGVRTHVTFFSQESARLLAQEKRADVIIANNVMAHMPDINDVVAGIANLLAPDGVFVLETPYVKDLIDHLEYDTIYHEHVFYYSLSALKALFIRHGLCIENVARLSIHGGTIRVLVRHVGAADTNPSVTTLLEEEAKWGANQRCAYFVFVEQVKNLCETLKIMLLTLRRQNYRIAAYGAAAKGATLLHSIGEASKTIEYVVDRSFHKQGRCMPGSHLFIYPPDRLLENMPDYTLLLTWNFADEIMTQQAEYLRRGGKFIIPLPQPRFITSLTKSSPQ